MTRFAQPLATDKAEPSTAAHATRSSTARSDGSQIVSAEGLVKLQRTAGNAAVGAMLSRRRTSLTPPVQRDVITTNPVLIKSGDTDAKSDQRQKISNDAIAGLPIWASNYANLWLTAGTTALAGVQEPEDPKAKQNWWVALAGNLTWAATSLLAPELTGAIRLMSFAGAAVGSGVLAANAAPSGKGVVGLQLGKARDSMIQKTGSLVQQVAVECGFDMESDIEKQKQRLWKKLLPGVPYENSEAIVANMQTRIASGLSQFLEQWKVWDSGDEGATPEKLGASMTKGGLLEQLFMPKQDTFVVMEQLRQQWKIDHPFKPDLKF